jgi:DNA topoisomerase-1
MNLMIIESPGKIEKLKAILGDGWMIAASVGHIRDLPINEMGVSAPDFIPQYVLTERGEATVARISKLINSASKIYLGTDPDREGESISWHLNKCLKLKEYTRITFNEVTESGIKKAFEAARKIDMQLVASQEARRVLDRLYGYMVSPAISDAAADNLSAGRVQSVAVLLVVQRERQIVSFASTKHFGAKLIFADAKTGKDWFVEWVKKPDFISEDNPYFLDRDFASTVNQLREVKVISCVDSESTRNPPAPFTTSTLQQAASVTFGFDPVKTMSLAQKLYDQGHITYHRTDNPNISVESFAEIKAVALSLDLPIEKQPRLFPTPDGAQAGHPGITPTHWEIDSAGTDDDEKAIYKLIRLRALSSQLEGARYANRSVKMVATDTVSGKVIHFEGSGKVLTSLGWRKLINEDQTDEDADNGEVVNPVPSLQAGEMLVAASGELLELATRAPKRYTQASLIKKLESERIGRPATYAAIMENIMGREYVVTEKKFLRPTAKGEEVVRLLLGNFSFMDIGFTRDLENELDLIAKGEASYIDAVAPQHAKLEKDRFLFNSSVLPKFPCPSCGKSLRRRKGNKGDFWGCAGYPNCAVTLPDEGGKPGQSKSQIASEFKCEKCGELLNRKSIKGGFILWSCSGAPKGCKAVYANAQNKPILQNK